MPRPPLSLRDAALALLVVAGAVLSGCVGERPTLADETEPTIPGQVEPPAVEPASVEPTPEPATLVATARGDSIEIFADPTASEPEREITGAEATSEPGIPIVFLVKDEQDARLEVHLPVRPNGSTGWVDRADVEVSEVAYRIEVSISEHRLQIFKDDDVVIDEPVGVGRTDRPTPGGIYYLKELLEVPTPDGIYGPYAYGLSGFSPVLDSFNGGPGVIGIHGTNQPELLGEDVSSGCIRVHNDVVEHLVNNVGLPLGTPVEILS